MSTPRVLGRTCAAEWTRLWTVRTSWWFLLAATVVLLGVGALVGTEVAGEPAGASQEPAWRVASAAVVPAQFALLGLALTAVTADHGTGGIVPTLQWTPRRGVLSTARAAVAVLSATALGVVLAAASAGTAALASGGRLDLPAADGVRVLGTVALVVAAGAALAVGLGALLRSTAGALVGVFLLVLVLPLLLGNAGWAWATAVAEALPGTGAVSLLLGEDGQGTTRQAAVTVLLAWAGGALLLGWLRTVRDDVR
ncbi:hypothetical protein [Geodermatophilus sp. SYSU D00766]